MAFEWLGGLFQSDNHQTRGLSGDQAHSVALDDSNPYYNFRLRRHKAEGDLIGDPGLLWYTSPYVKRRSGLGTHVGAEVGDMTANYTDILLILSQEDFARATPDWQQQATRSLQQEFDSFCRRENFNRVHAHRPLGVRIIEDGSEAMNGQSLLLARGEFMTGLLPNLYTGPVRGSYPVIGVHLNLPGVWDGYQEVGRLYNDQILFTLGNHWLDNFSHPSLQQAALYRLRQYPDGSFVHIVNPDLQDQYQVTSTNQGGASVLTLATRSGKPLAYMVLAVIDPPAAKPTPSSATGTGAIPRAGTPGSATTPVSANRRPDISMPKSPGMSAQGISGARDARSSQPDMRPGARSYEGSVPSIAPPMMIEDVGGNKAVEANKTGLGGKTIIPDAPSERIFTLQERGALLQKVHFSAFMLGYDVYLGSRGELGTHVEDPAATFQVRKRSVSLVAHVDGVLVDGRPVAAGVEVPIEGDMKIEVAGQKLDYRDLRGLNLDGWPYVGEIRRPTSSTYMIWGEDYQIGRSRECRVVLPDEPRNDNIHWKPSVGDGATIRARTGEIQKSRFYTDSIMVASEHASIDLRGDKPRVVCTARHCFAYVRRNNEVLSLYPTTSPQEPKELELIPGDELLIGNCLFHVGFTAGEAVAPAPAPKVELTPEGLTRQVASPDLKAFDRDTVPPPGRAEIPPPMLPPPMTPPERGSPIQGARPNGTMPSQGSDPIPEELSEDTPLTATPEPPPLRDPSKTGRPGSPNGNVRTAGSLDERGLLDLPAAGGPKDPRLEDQPTSPGMPLPRSQSSLSQPQGDAAGQVVGDDPDAYDRPPNDVAGWDQDDWSEDVPVREPGSSQAALERSRAPMTASEAEIIMVPQTTNLASLGSGAERSQMPNGTASNTGISNAAAQRPVDRSVVFVDDAEAQFEIGRPMHFVLVGWMVNGEVICGNHRGCDLIVPENRVRPDQHLEAREYFRLKVRGRKGSIEILAPTEVDVDGQTPEPSYEDPEQHTFEIVRRDDGGERDFTVRLSLVEDKRLPDPRARFVAVDTEDPLAGALVTRGLPKGAPRTLTIDALSLTMLYDGTHITISNYLPTYRRPDGTFHPFFVQRGEGRFKTAPEDGSPFQVRAQDRVVIGPCVYVLREE